MGLHKKGYIRMCLLKNEATKECAHIKIWLHEATQEYSYTRAKIATKI